MIGGAGLVALGTTVLWAIPMHNKLDRIGQSESTIDSLLQANLLRSFALTIGTLAIFRELLRGTTEHD